LRGIKKNWLQGIERVVAKKLERVAVKLIGARRGRDG
jgi:hypothetical protein